jgi:hypothetical protein
MLQMRPTHRLSRAANRRVDVQRELRRSFGSMARMARSRTADPSAAPNSLQFSAINGILLTAALAVIASGYLLLSRGSTVGAPLLLVLGYAVLLPLAIIL